MYFRREPQRRRRSGGGTCNSASSTRATVPVHDHDSFHPRGGARDRAHEHQGSHPPPVQDGKLEVLGEALTRMYRRRKGARRPVEMRGQHGKVGLPRKRARVELPPISAMTGGGAEFRAMYLAFCADCRRSGLPEPTIEDWISTIERHIEERQEGLQGNEGAAT